jgi:beta-phosphoglucomutase-like phosphatase (HAD superfamily)
VKPAINPARLGFDFDGVIADTAEAFLRIACEEHGLCGFRLEEITRFEVEHCLDMSAETAAAIFGAILKDSLGSGLRPMPGALDVISELAAVGGMVTVVTARPLLEPVLDWFAHHLPPLTLKAVRVVAMGDHDDKPRHIFAQGLDHFIDDRAETCQQLHAAGIQPLIFRQPWNQHCSHFPAVNSWQDIRNLCLQQGD